MNSESSELTVTQYARLHGLSADHLAEPLPLSLIEALQEEIPKGLSDDSDLTQVELPLCVNLHEALFLDERGAELIRDANNGVATAAVLEGTMLSLLDVRYTKKLRLETPLLRTDHETDFRSFASWEDSHFEDARLPWEPLDDEMDVGLEWPKRLKDLPAKVMNEVESEKLEIHRDTMVYLQATIKESWTAADERNVWESVAPYKTAHINGTQ